MKFLKVLFYLVFIALGLVALTTCATCVYVFTGDHSDSSPAEDTNGKVNKANFERVRPGMSRSQVDEILGDKSEILSTTKIGDQIIELRVYKARGIANATITFQENRVISTASFGLN